MPVPLKGVGFAIAPDMPALKNDIPSPSIILNTGPDTVAVIPIVGKPSLATVISVIISGIEFPNAINVTPKYEISISDIVPII